MICLSTWLEQGVVSENVLARTDDYNPRPILIRHKSRPLLLGYPEDFT